jgi:hypothetical protein
MTGGENESKTDRGTHKISAFTSSCDTGKSIRWLLTSSTCIPLERLTLTRLSGIEDEQFKILLQRQSTEGRL